MCSIDVRPPLVPVSRSSHRQGLLRAVSPHRMGKRTSVLFFFLLLEISPQR